MNSLALHLLRRVARKGEVSLQEAISLATPIHKNHKDQYPLALLLEEDYLGITVNNSPPYGAENMREYSWAIFFHAFTLPKDINGEVHYLGVTYTDIMDPTQIAVFIKVKGLLYLDSRNEKFRDSIFFFIAGILAAFIGKWLEDTIMLLVR